MIEVFDCQTLGLDKYVVVIDDDVYGMSIDPQAPLGFNMYIGDISEFIDYCGLGKQITWAETPPLVKKAIIDRMNNYEIR